ncbi:MAG: FkbM family methyltransferase [Aulosira sp. ZfuVER01]|nr:FkbM family methyltransferase [Aulosira sp. ZfuVER01]MDZ7997747.1 FkbM family methyltransferase [Aulosira sp. DedVER01a]MDZ8052242.1 FkbM family methyltransferase [Aulosira sp. ZfuCHP01]
MNIWRFLKKCFTDPAAAEVSAKLVARSFYSQCYWSLNPSKSLLHHLPNGGILLLEPGHSFTHCFYPGVDQYEPDVRLALRYFLKPGDYFIDCGANIGYFSIEAGKLVGEAGKVISIEANPITFSLLERNLKLNQLGIPIHCALTSQRGEVDLFMPVEGGDVYSSLRKGKLVSGGSIESFKVLGQTLDDIVHEQCLPKVDLVKIDIEGAELDVLNSATNVLSTFRPVIITEYGTNTWPSFGATPKDLKNLAKKYSYLLKMFDMSTKRFVSVTEDIWLSPYANIIMLPEERLAEFG